jgi:hypothetical protein
MNRCDDAGAQARASYEIHLSGPLPQSLRIDFPTVLAATAPAETVLVRDVEQGTELDTLLDQLLFMGLVLSEVHECPAITTLPRDAITALPHPSVVR